MSNYEIENAEFEYQRNKAIDSYFKARPQVIRTIEKEYLVAAGFRMAWDIFNDTRIELNKAKEDVSDFGIGFLYDGKAIDAAKVIVLK